MKKLLLITGSFILLMACQEKKETASINGVYKMDSQEAFTTDTDSLLMKAENPNQIKMFTDTHFLWVKFGADSVGNFGIGSYTFADGKVQETSIFTSDGNENPAKFEVNVELTETGYNQEIPSMDYNGSKIKLTEKYTRAVEGAAGDLDGLYKASNNYFVKGADTIRQNYPDYKMYNKGNFAWAIRPLMDTAKNAYVAYLGAGTFTQEGDLVKETTTLTNLPGDGLGIMELKITNKTENEFIQVINQKDGSVRYTTYTKVK